MDRKQNYEVNVRQILEVMNKMLVDRVDAITINSKIPFKAVSMIDVFLYRVVELGEDALLLYEHRRLMSSFIISRALFETAAVMQWSVLRMNNFIATGEITPLDEGLMVGLHGYRLEGAT